MREMRRRLTSVNFLRIFPGGIRKNNKNETMPEGLGDLESKTTVGRAQNPRRSPSLQPRGWGWHLPFQKANNEPAI